MEKTYGPVEKVLILTTPPGVSFPEHEHETDTVTHYPERTPDGRIGYNYIPRFLKHCIPLNTSRKTRISVYIRLK